MQALGSFHFGSDGRNLKTGEGPVDAATSPQVSSLKLSAGHQPRSSDGRPSFAMKFTGYREIAEDANEDGIEDEVAQVEEEEWRRGMTNVRKLFDQVDGLDASAGPGRSGIEESQRSAFGLDQSDNNYATIKSRKSMRDRAETEKSQGQAFEKLIG